MSVETVKNGIVVADSTIRRAIVACVAVSSSTRVSPFPRAICCGCAPVSAAAFCTSSRVIRPPGPVPTRPWSETPSSTAVRLATGVAFGRCAPAPSCWGLTPAGSDPCLSRFASVAIGSPIAAVPPSGTRIESSVPPASAS